MNQLIFILICIGMYQTAFAQNYISGTVSDAETGQHMQGVHVLLLHHSSGTVTDQNGQYNLYCYQRDSLEFVYPGYQSQIISVEKKSVFNISLKRNFIIQMDTVITFDPEVYEEQIQIVTYEVSADGRMISRPYGSNININNNKNTTDPVEHTEEYSNIEPNTDQHVLDQPLSTFGIDVDQAAYSNVRRFINQGQAPPVDAVRIEELINYFDYDYPQPKDDVPFSIQTEVANCPWNKDRKLLHIGLQGKEIDYQLLPPSNLVFLLDVSGSMSQENKLPLVKKAFKLLVENLREKDQVSIVVYAGAAGLILSPTFGDEKQKILEALNQLKAGGSTAGGEGIQLAYQIAKEHFIPKGNNRVIIATDGDFNVGISNNNDLLKLIEEKRQDRIFLTTLGFGMGNYKDDKLELLADKGNGNYAYIDHFAEATKVFVHDLRGNLFTIAKDVKIQVEFNPFYVQSYRLVGYENRLLNNEDFVDDTKDAGEIGVGHSVTVLYELVLQNNKNKTAALANIPLRYQERIFTKRARKKKELCNIQIRYKAPDKDQSELITKIVSKESMNTNTTSANFKFAAAVAGFGLQLRESSFNQTLDAKGIQLLAEASLENDVHGYRKEFIDLVGKYELLKEEE